MARYGRMALLQLYAGRWCNRTCAPRRARIGGEGAREVIRVRKPTTYHVRNDEGHPVASHHRMDHSDGSKQMWWELPDGSKGLNGTPLADLPLYGSEQVDDCYEDELIVVVEGEKARDALEDAGVP